jgi:SAM-dependent methyltransferase
MASATTSSIYLAGEEAPLDHVRQISQSPDKPKTPAKPTFGIDSPAGLLASNITAPLYLYASLRGKFQVWDELLAETPDDIFTKPALDVGCGRGMVLVKIAKRKKKMAMKDRTTSIPPVYGIDIFNSKDQTGNSPVATFSNIAAVDVLDYVVLHSASFTERFPFVDDAFSLVTASLSLHNVPKEGIDSAVREIARVCTPGGKVIIVDISGLKDHCAILKELGWSEVSVRGAGLRMLYGILPCQILVAMKPPR